MGVMQNIDRQIVISNPKTLFVYDDYEKKGKKKDPDDSLASEVRNLPNTVGIKTRKFPQRNLDSYWKDFRNYGLDPNNRMKRRLNNPIFQKRHTQMRRDMANVIKKFVTGDFEKIIFSSDLLNGIDFRESNSAHTHASFKVHLKKVRKYCKKFEAEGKLNDQEKLGLEAALNRDIYDLLKIP